MNLIKDLILKIKNATGLNLMECHKVLKKFNNNADEAIKFINRESGNVCEEIKDKYVTQHSIFAVSQIESFLHVFRIYSGSDFTIRTEEVRNFAINLCQSFLQTGIFDKSLVETVSKQCGENISYEYNKFELGPFKRLYCHSVIQTISIKSFKPDVSIVLCRGLSLVLCNKFNNDALMLECCYDAYDLNCEDIEYLSKNSDNFKSLTEVNRVIVFRNK